MVGRANAEADKPALAQGGPMRAVVLVRDAASVAIIGTVMAGLHYDSVLLTSGDDAMLALRDAPTDLMLVDDAAHSLGALACVRLAQPLLGTNRTPVILIGPRPTDGDASDSGDAFAASEADGDDNAAPSVAVLADERTSDEKTTVTLGESSTKSSPSPSTQSSPVAAPTDRRVLVPGDNVATHCQPSCGVLAEELEERAKELRRAWA